MKKKSLSYLTVIIGILLLIAGFMLLRLISEAQGIMLVLPYICIGLGCGTFGHGVGNLVSEKAIQKYPEIQKQMEIEKNDERNIAILNQAKAKAYNTMIYVFGALMISLALMNVDIIMLILLVSAYLFVIGVYIYYSNKYNQ